MKINSCDLGETRILTKRFQTKTQSTNRDLDIAEKIKSPAWNGEQK
jgi:hypothetical protein